MHAWVHAWTPAWILSRSLDVFEPTQSSRAAPQGGPPDKRERVPQGGYKYLLDGEKRRPRRSSASTTTTGDNIYKPGSTGATGYDVTDQDIDMISTSTREDDRVLLSQQLFRFHS